MLKLVKNYINNEDGLSEAAQTILLIVISIAVVGVIAFIVYSIVNGGKSDAESGITDYENIVGDINGLR